MKWNVLDEIISSKQNLQTIITNGNVNVKRGFIQYKQTAWNTATSISFSECFLLLVCSFFKTCI